MKHASILRSFCVTLSLLGATNAPAQTPRVEVAMRNFSFAPTTLHLRAGQPVTLHLTNASARGHSFSSPAFFAASTVSPETRSVVHDGLVDVPKHASVDVTVTPSAGTYPLKCSHAFHKMMGMTGTILVD
jgi:plastocyanin